MSLTIDRRSYGSIYILECSGIIGVGDSLPKLEEALERSLIDANRMVVELSGVDRIDSTGMGLLVRFLARARHKGGDLRLASPTSFVRKLLVATKLDTVFLVYTSDHNAIASFFLRGAPGEKAGEATATVLFVDQSNDLCAFARSVLGQHGYEVVSTGRLRDAQLLALAASPEIIVMGPRPAELGIESVVQALQSAAPKATITHLPADFAQSQPHHATTALLNAVKQGKAASA